MPKLVNLRGVFTGKGFESKGGRFPTLEDAGFIEGPVDLAWNEAGTLIDPAGAKGAVIDGAGLVATSGFVDSHTHAFFSGDRSFEYALRWQGASYADIAKEGGGILLTQTESARQSDLTLLNSVERRLLNFVALGSTTVEIKSGYATAAQEELRHLRLLKQLSDRNLKKHPRTLRTFLGLHALPKGQDETAFVNSMISILPEIEKEKLAHFVDAFPEKGFFSLESAQRFIAAAQKHGLSPKVHADEITDMNASATFADMGAQSVDHLQMISDVSVDALKHSGTVATLLPATSFYLKIPYANARRLLTAGVPVALASDFNPGTAPNPSLTFSGLLALSELQMSAAEVLCATTLNGAQALGVEAQCGSLSVGKSADILLWDLESRSNKPDHWLYEIFVQQKCPHQVVLRGKL